MHPYFVSCLYLSDSVPVLAWQLCEFTYLTVRGALLCSCWLFAPRFSAIDSLQECSQLFEALKGGTAFAG